jgi:hypothetical protein
MRIKSILPTLIMTVAAISFSLSSAEAANVSVNINGFIPPPPGVFVQVDAGRPYYVEHDRRVYMERERPGKHRKHYKEKKHHDNGNKYGHDKDGHGGGRGH